MLASSAVPFLNNPFFGPYVRTTTTKSKIMAQDLPEKSLMGAYGNWASEMIADLGTMSFRNTTFADVDNWKPKATSKALQFLALPDIQQTSAITVHKKYSYDGLSIEEISWPLSNGGGAVEAIVMKPEQAKGTLPAILALHDHGGNKYFGKRKIVQCSEDRHPLIEQHQQVYYEGLAWANEVAKRGYVVMVHDVFAFGSRRVFPEDVDEVLLREHTLKDFSSEEWERPDIISEYNKWASDHEHVLSKSLFCAGTTWPGVVLAEDQIALNILCERKDVDASRIGCAGLSGGGLRTVYLGGLDHRISCAVSVGFMSTWKDFMLYKAYTHTWMLYAPLLPRFLEFPEILGLRVPLPTMVQNNIDDQLFTLSEMKMADSILTEVYKKAKAPDKYSGKFYEGLHKFDAAMQVDAFDWFDRWLKG